MNINNETSTVSSTARQYFYSQIPFGSDYVIFTSGDNEYTMYLRRVGQKKYTTYRIKRVRQGSTSSYYYNMTHDTTEYDYTNFTVSYPYYSYSNIDNCGIREALPCESGMSTLMLIVLASCAVLTVVFGGVRLCRRR